MKELKIREELEKVYFENFIAVKISDENYAVYEHEGGDIYSELITKETTMEEAKRKAALLQKGYNVRKQYA